MKFDVPTRSEVNETNQGIFDHLEKAVGFVPNIYATFASSNNALKNYLDFACLLYTSPSPRDGLLSRMPSSA